MSENDLHRELEYSPPWRPKPVKGVKPLKGQRGLFYGCGPYANRKNFTRRVKRNR